MMRGWCLLWEESMIIYHETHDVYADCAKGGTQIRNAIKHMPEATNLNQAVSLSARDSFRYGEARFPSRHRIVPACLTSSINIRFWYTTELQSVRRSGGSMTNYTPGITVVHRRTSAPLR